jgi:hypothetical protein
MRPFSPSAKMPSTSIWQLRTFEERRDCPAPFETPRHAIRDVLQCKESPGILLREFSYSFRNATTGSIDDAFRAGR